MADGKMDFRQKIEDNGRLQKDSKDKMKHWRKRHEDLELVYVEYVHAHIQVDLIIQ